MVRKKLSLIIPVYGTERYLKRCIESVLEQNYRELEIIIVNDCSPGNAEEIISEYKKKDDRIVYIKHEINRGLFQARLTGAKAATGEYIAFLDSDDYVTFDFYYSLVQKMQEEQADIVIGKTVVEQANGQREINHFHDCCLNVDVLIGNEVKNTFFEQQGRCYSWHTIWNKLYRKSLWDRAFPYYQKITSHVIMTEDIAFSTVLFYFAKKVATVQSAAYFYCANEGASTDSNNMTIKRFKKNVNDIITVFNFVGDFLREQNADETIMGHYEAFRKFYASLWLTSANSNFVGKYRKEALNLIEALYPKLMSKLQPEDYFFDSFRVKWNDGIEVAKAMINCSEIEYISFDIFDTLITRSLYKPEHVFKLMNSYFYDLTKSNVPFEKIRIDGERIARKLMGISFPEYQDVTLSEIYEQIGTSYKLNCQVVELLKKREIELEISLCHCRQTIRNLFELAKNLGKHVIIVSDMYLEREVIEKILDKNGYRGYEQLYLSSEQRLTKNTGDLFKYVLNDLNVPANKIVHFGDTWVNDIVNPQRLGFKTFLIPKTLEVFENKIKGQNTNFCAELGNLATGGIIKLDAYKESVGYGAMMSVVANKYFDNPFRTFQQESDLNVDPYFIGYYVLGMHLYGLSEWLVEQSKLLGYKKLYFLSRDGYLPMLVYKIIASQISDAPEACYLYSSRKAVMPYIINSEFDLYAYPTEIRNQSALKMRHLLNFCMRDNTLEEYKTTFLKSGIDSERRFASKEEYNKFVDIFIKEFYSKEKHEKAKMMCSKYYSCIGENEATVDMGYSGRIQGAISAAVGHGVDVFFVHADSNQYLKESHVHEFKIHSFYDYEPCMSGLCREHICSSFEPSCVGFTIENDQVVPVFENEHKAIQDKWCVEQLHKGALNFVADFINQLGVYRKEISLKPHEISLPYEGFLRFSKEIDLKIFSASFFEDEVWGGTKKINIADFIQEQHNKFNEQKTCLDIPIQETNHISKYDPPIAVAICNCIRKYDLLYKVARKIYRKMK